MVKYSISMNRLLLSSTCFGGFAAENVPRTIGILFTFFRSRCIRLKTTSSRSLPSSILTDQLFRDTRIQVIPEPAMAGSFSSSSQIRPPLQLTSFVSRWQSARIVQRSDSRRLVFYSTRAIGLEGRE